MAAFMVVYMDITDPSWVPAYFADVPQIFSEYGGVSVAGGLEVASIEGTTPPPGRMAVLSFPSLDAIHHFMQDTRYVAHRRAREQSARTDIFIFENKVAHGKLV